ncbi:hypothetical protein FACS189444_4290 [Spirochaetia bacterium]|nr:hypothetical protein FACS189444_4290 [Spirochaetia bacterium]
MKSILRILRPGAALCVVLFALFLPAANLFAKVNFSGLDISTDNRLLFRADTAGNDGASAQGVLFLTNLMDLSFSPLTAFPEKIELIENGRTLQVRNTFGAVRIPISGGLPRNIPGLPSLTQRIPAMGGRLEEMAASADGKWLLYVEPVTAATGTLVLIETATGKKTTISTEVERADHSFPASWSPDSRMFVYCRKGKLYYQTVLSAAINAIRTNTNLRMCPSTGNILLCEPS